MKNIPSIQRPALLGLFTLALGITGIVRAQPPSEKPAAADIEKTDPFDRRPSNGAANADQEPTADQLDAQARVLFARGETEKAIELQGQALGKASETLANYKKNYDRYMKWLEDERPNEFKLRTLIVPAISFEDVSLEDALKYLHERSVEADPSKEKDGARKGINFHLVKESADAGQPSQAAAIRIKQLRLRNVPLGVALKYICEQMHATYSVDEYGVTVTVK